MFSPDRQGFFPALWVQFVQELGEGERREFAALTERFFLFFKDKDKDKNTNEDRDTGQRWSIINIIYNWLY